jgi:hypothetical protein
MWGHPAHLSAKQYVFLWVLIVCLVSLPTCTQAPRPPAPWTDIRVLAQAEQSTAPALLIHNDFLIAAWVGSDTRGVHQNARLVTGESMQDALTLPLPPRQPKDQRLLPGTTESAHLLWMDMNEAGQMRLYTASLSMPDLAVERGPTAVSERLTLRYAALAHVNGGVLAAWSGGSLAEPTVTLRLIDNEGRPTERLGILPTADFPVLLHEGRSFYVIWKGVLDDAVYRTELTNDSLGSTTRLTSSPSLARGDRLMGLHAGQDETHTYVFWNIMRSGGICEMWYAAGSGDAVWSQPQLLRLGHPDHEYLETGYNSGEVNRIAPGTLPVCFGTPVSDVGLTLPLAAHTDDGLVIIYFQAGQPAGEQLVVPGATVLTPPLMLTDRNRRLFLVWAQPTIAGYANLQLVATR